MPDFLVQSDTRLTRFLLRNRVMQWRIPILIQYGGVKVLQAGTKRELPLDGLKTRVSAGDTVRVVTPPPKPCADAMQKEANTNCRDYAIVPGATPAADKKKRGYKPTFDDLMADYVSARPKTVVIQNASMMTLDGFLSGIATSDEFIYPIRYLMVVGHASSSGAFRITISAGTSVDASVSYEALEEAVAKKYLVVDMDLMQPRPAGAGPAELRLLGCSVGAQVPYMQKLKEALGGKITLIAPKFLAMPDKIASPPGPIAYLGYDFTLHCPMPAKDRKTLLGLFDAKSKAAEKKKDPRFTLRSGKHVPTTSWAAWVPRDMRKHRYSVLGKKLPKDPPTLPSPVMLPVIKTKASARRRFLINEKFPYYRDPFTQGPKKQSMPLPKNTGKPADWKAAVRKWLEGTYKHPYLPGKTIKLFDPSHPFPAYVRAGYETMDEFMDGWDWQFDYDDKTKTLNYSPIRYEYRIWQPITTEPGNELIMNYYPKTIPKRFSKLLPLTMLFVTDKTFFGVY
ncbi:hypothetical protein W02_03860 [Nitrospira sp. KM1]|uniref:hypothetical protein n=1 Tax=Nitrospira sp. KM1 TaxID=1936990 RepID=UPI0013A71EB1|nr:hypothetical protein [Nitrospira sp. KM1]BCA53246.1 hypothetical protein W02_03860 [Nitrospira sp. KM1]